jgi:cation diffusion facilitator CzcD-associated flavoprotein CzcO
MDRARAHPGGPPRSSAPAATGGTAGAAISTHPERAAADGPRHVFAAILGSGFSGLAVAIQLKRAGIEDFVILERGDALGGTWRDNDYPGCACDVPSHLYSYSFAPKPDWSRAFAPHHEIRAYLERVADELGVRRHIELCQHVTEASWDEERACWHLRTEAGETLTATVVVSAVGALSNPAYPQIPGLERFRGKQMHSAEWDHGYDFTGKRVGVIGTGASAIQIVPQLQQTAGRLVVFQRTPPWVLHKGDRAFSSVEKTAFAAIPGLRWLYRQSIFWALEARVVAFEHPALMKLAERLGKRHIARGIADPELRARVTPTHTPGCKRVLLSNDYYPALARANVEVCTDAISEVTDDAIVLADGRRIDVDALVFGTGFRVHDYLGGMKVHGRGGRALQDTWRDGAEAYLGTTVAGFPNLFLMTGPNTGLGHNSMIVMIEGQATFAAKAIEEARADVQARYVEWLRGRSAKTVWKSGCMSWYLDRAGRNTTVWPGLASAYRARVSRLREQDFTLRARAEET